jgi:hypothetical protein
LTAIDAPFLGGEFAGESFFFLKSFLLRLNSSNDKLGVGSGMIVGLGWIGFRLPDEPMARPPAMTWGPVAGTIGRAFCNGRMGLALMEAAEGLL